MIKQRNLEEIAAQLDTYWPNEICGYFAGVGGSITMVLPVTNVASNPATSFLMEPQSQLNALLSVANSKASILAIYHSHPARSLERPSQRDLSELSDPNYLYVVIVPDENRMIDSLRVFRLNGGKAVEVPLYLDGPAGISSQLPAVG